MAAHDPNPLHAAINVKLAQIVADSPESPPWYEAWKPLGPESSEEDRLAVDRAVRDAGSLPEEPGCFLGSCPVEGLKVSPPGPVPNIPIIVEQYLRQAGYQGQVLAVQRATRTGL